MPSYLKTVVLLFFLIAPLGLHSQNFKLVKTIKQRGPVAYRDPFGSISPDGSMVAYSDLRSLMIQPVNGGGAKLLDKNNAFIRYLTWAPDNKRLLTYEIGVNSERWFVYNLEDGTSQTLWPDIQSFNVVWSGEEIEISKSHLRELSWSADGKKMAGIVGMNGMSYVITLTSEGKNPSILTRGEKIESLLWNPARTGWAGIIVQEGQRYLDLNLGFVGNPLIEAESYGRIAFGKLGELIYYTQVNERGVVDLWMHDLVKDERNRLTNFARDSYEPSTSEDGKLMFKLQDYRIFLGMVDGNGGSVKTLTSFQSEIPYWHPNGQQLSFTYGSWRRLIDDAKYPDIAQDLGVINLPRTSPADTPDEVIRASYSEDQGMCWSPNLKWIAFHTHADGTDDIWIQPVGQPSAGRPLSKDGYETGWPRWSPDGQWIVSNTAYSEARINKLFLIGIDQDKGKVTTAQKNLSPPGLEGGSFTDSQWTSDSRNLIVEYVVDEDTKEIHMVPIDGTPGKMIHRFESDQLYSGIGLSNDDQWIAYIAPDENGYYQVFKVSANGEIVVQLTSDPTDKAHPVYSPTEDKVAFSVFNYQSIFWMLEPEP